jgi:hypothetical protein
MTAINSSVLAQAMSYGSYMTLTEQLIEEGRTSGPNQSEPYVYYTKLNFQRMKRLNKTIEVPARIIELLKEKAANWTWVIITEPWCGDAAQCVPVLEKIAQTNSLVKTAYLLRDEHPEVMDAYLTNEGRAIPKLICLDDSANEIFTWGPRPAVIQEVMNRLKAEGITEIATIVEEIQKAYNADHQAGVYEEMEAVLAAL